MADCSQKREQQSLQQQQAVPLEHVPQRADSADTTSRPETPVTRPSMTGVTGTPATPNSSSLMDLSAGTPQTAKTGPYCPQPRRALPNQNPMMPGSPRLYFREETGVSAYEEEAHTTVEGHTSGHANYKGLGSRPLSSASTSEGATPAPDLDARLESWLRSQTPSMSLPPDVYSALQEISTSTRFRAILENHGWNGREFAKMPNHEQLLKDLVAANKPWGGSVISSNCVTPSCSSPPPGANNKCKVFVGGVPQTMSTLEFNEAMARYGPIRKAWLQKNRPPQTGALPDLSRPAQNHRGFGFVIYYDVASVDRLLGNKDSVYINISEHQRLEIKRAVSANDLPAATTAGTPTLSRKSSWQENSYRRGSPASPMDQRYLSRSPASNPTPTPGQQSPFPLIPPLELSPAPMANLAKMPQNSTNRAPTPGEEQQMQQMQQQQQQQQQQQHQQVHWQAPMAYQAASMTPGHVMVQHFAPMTNQHQPGGMQVACPPFPMAMGNGCCYAGPMAMPTMPMANVQTGPVGGCSAPMMVHGMPDGHQQAVIVQHGTQWIATGNGQMQMPNWQPMLVPAPQQLQQSEQQAANGPCNFQQQQQQQQQPPTQMLPPQLQPDNLATFCGHEDLESRLREAQPEAYED